MEGRNGDKGAGRGRKRKAPVPSAADLFDSLLTQEEKAAEAPVAKKGKKVLPIPKKVKFAKNESKTAGSDSEPEECVFLSFDSGNKKNAPPLAFAKKSAPSSAESSPEKIRTPVKEDTTVKSGVTTSDDKDEIKDSALDPETISDQEQNEKSAKDAPKEEEKAESEENNNKSANTLTGVSKEMEDSIRAEIEMMLANNRLRRNGDADALENGSYIIDSDIILINNKTNKACKFLVRRQEDGTPESMKDYVCVNCAYRSNRMNNIMRHYRECRD